MKYQTKVSRLAAREERATVKKIAYLSILSVAIAAFIFTLGIPLLGNFADFLDSLFTDKVESPPESGSLLAPSLDEQPQATNSARLAIGGFASQAELVEIYLNDQRVGEARVNDSQFIYDDLILQNGENKIAAKSKADEKTSDFSQIVTVVLDTEEPLLEIGEPSDGQSFSGNNRIKVSGKSDKDAQVFANNFLAAIDFDGKFEVLVPVGEGENNIEIKAVDLAGNSKIETRKVNFRK